MRVSVCHVMSKSNPLCIVCIQLQRKRICQCDSEHVIVNLIVAEVPGVCQGLIEISFFCVSLVLAGVSGNRVTIMKKMFAFEY